MQVSPKFSDYFSAVKLDRDFSSREKIEKYIEENPQRFSYGSVDYPAYETIYSPKGDVQRKRDRIVAIPAALRAGIVKSIYHLAKVIFYGIPKACSGEGRHIKADAYRIARDMEEALGWLVTLFNEKRGSYLIQESLFQKECYNYFEAQKEVSSSLSSRTISSPLPSRSLSPPLSSLSNNSRSVPSSQGFYWDSGTHCRSIKNGVWVPHNYEAEEITLRKFREMSSEARQEAIKKFQLQRAIDAIGQEQFFQKLNEANEQVLELVNLADLTEEISKIEYALLSDNEFKKITIGQLKDASSEQMLIISQRIRGLQDVVPEEGFDQNLFEFPVVQLHRVPGQKLSEVFDKIPEIFDKIPESILTLITDTQLKQLNLKNANEKQINQLFCYIDGKEEKRRFALLSVRQVQDILGKLGKNQLKLISDDQLKELDLSDLSSESLQKLFDYIDGVEEYRRFALLSVRQVQDILGKLGKNQLKLISDDQLKELDLSDLSSENLQKLFDYTDGVEEKRRFALLSARQVKYIFEKLGKYQFKLISDDHLKELDLSDFSSENLQKLFDYIDGVEEYRRFALLSARQVKYIIEKLGKYQFKLISDDHLKELDLSDLSSESLQKLFCYIDGNEEKRRFACVPVAQVQAVLGKLSLSQLTLISDDQLNKLNLNDMPADLLQKVERAKRSRVK